MSRKLSPAATAAAPPPLDPPGVRSRSHGLRVRPYTVFTVCPKSASISCGLVVAAITAPAARIRRTTVASQSDTGPTNAGLPHVVGIPATCTASLTVTGTPPSGPPAAEAASASAASPRVPATAHSAGFSASMCSYTASTSSTGPIPPADRRGRIGGRAGQQAGHARTTGSCSSVTLFSSSPGS